QGISIYEDFRDHISKIERIGKYHDKDESKKSIELLIVTLKKESSIEYARTMQRNLAAKYLNGSRGGTKKDAALIAYVSPNKKEWRFSFVKMEYKLEINTSNGKPKVIEDYTPAKRWSFLVGEEEKSHTAQSRFVEMIENDEKNPSFQEIENAFDIEKVSKKFFIEYKDLFIQLNKAMEEVLKSSERTKNHFQEKKIDVVDFTKKLLGQIVFLYFLQKKGWFGVKRDQKWGEGSKQFLRELFEKKHGDYKNFFSDILEPLFYEALRMDQSHDDHYYSRFDCKIPFLNGGLFDPAENYDWVNDDVNLPNELFSNAEKTSNGDIGTGILDVFDRYNFTVKEDEPLEKEVAIDPELLGKTYEKFNAIRSDNIKPFLQAVKSGGSKENQFNKKHGVYYTPREIVHYMCKESLTNYLALNLGEHIEKEAIKLFIEHGELTSENDQKIIRDKKETKTYTFKMPEEIRENAFQIDKLLSEITICDPAIGSGAFPLGMLNEIVKARKSIQPYISDNSVPSIYELKRACIEKSIHGVDIDSGAVEIAKLRLWLSLI
ncbi:MAG: class I SAM-dependent DNA methyltransferase, partial [Thermotogota bacterium]|nr:class I SAM-dependent DNA methyltransferase [Thermotogota bacterium]